MTDTIARDRRRGPLVAFAAMLALSLPFMPALPRQGTTAQPAAQLARSGTESVRPPGDAPSPETAPPDVIAPPMTGDHGISKEPPPAGRFPTRVYPPPVTPPGHTQPSPD